MPRPTPETGRGGGARARGLTLLELLIAVALLLALAAIALPSLSSTLAEREFEATVEMIRSQLLLARAHAELNGRPVEVLYAPEPARVEARWFVPGGGATDDGFLAGAPADRADDERITEGWAWRPLIESVDLRDTPPPDPDALPEPGDWFDDPDAGYAALGPDAIDAQPLRLAVFLPDGSALLAEPFWVADGDGRRGRLEVVPWTGLVLYERLADGAAAETEPDEDAEGEDELDPDADENWGDDDRAWPDESPADREAEPPAGDDTGPAGSRPAGDDR